MSSQIGRRAESLACLWLQAHGYHIVCRNLRAGRGEIDIIAHKNDVLAFVEVKKRPHHAAAIEAVSVDKQQRLQSAALAFIHQHPEWLQYDLRFDLISINRFWQVQHLSDAFR